MSGAFYFWALLRQNASWEKVQVQPSGHDCKRQLSFFPSFLTITFIFCALRSDHPAAPQLEHRRMKGKLCPKTNCARTYEFASVCVLQTGNNAALWNKRHEGSNKHAAIFNERRRRN